MKIKLLMVFLNSMLIFGQISSSQSVNSKIINIGSNLELFIDYFLIDTLRGTELKLHHPIDKGIVLKFDEPWEGQFSAYCTVIKDDSLFRLYYRGIPSAGKDGSAEEHVCYAESKDGINWTKPNLKIFQIKGSFNNNVVLANAAPVTHNFSPFLDTRKNVESDKRYKALGGLGKTGLIAYTSHDGTHWKVLKKDPVIVGRKSDFDSQNVSFWSIEEKSYICYYRTWVEENGIRYRSIARTTSRDFINWTNPIEMDFGNTPHEQLYTNQTSPYYRAQQIYISVAARFMPNRQVLSDDAAARLNVNPKYFKDCSDAVFMTTRGGNRYDRTFMESFIRPGIGLQNWVSRSNYPALNVVETSPTNISIYVTQDYAQPTSHLHRYELRIDGFTSINAPYQGGEMITKPIFFSGDSLVINFSTSAAGYIKVELIDLEGNKIPGFELENSEEIIGNEIEKLVTWNDNPELEKLNDIPVIIRFVMKDADLYSFGFH